MFTVEMLPAQRGDCLWITYGTGGELHHVIVDAGPRETIGTLVPELERRIAALPGRTNRVELLVISHIDADHVQGVVSLLSGPSRSKLFKDIWFNGWRHVSETLGAPDGERLDTLLEQDVGRWNKAFGGGPVVVPDLADGAGLPVKKLAGGMTLTLLSPDRDGLAAIARAWRKECKAAGLIPGEGATVPRSWQRSEILGFDPDVLARLSYHRDPSPANYSSIAFIASYGGRRVLFAADAHAEVVERSLGRLHAGPHSFDAVKAAHHGSKANHTMSMLAVVKSKRWLISTDGTTFHHPNPEAIARIVVSQDRPVLHFNYVSDEPHLADIISGAGDRYTVKLPKQRRDGTFAEGLKLTL